MKANNLEACGWFRIATAADYLDLSTRTVRRLIKGGMPCVKIPGSGTILINKEAVDRWLLRGQTDEAESDNQMVRELVKDLGSVVSG
jgi:excisionase family DNA binding protein